ncbi:MAG TPA: SDR family oxidoreductase [Methylococcus sp.]|nr:SDR family oxidoreductase [Methylococcus sp.]
MKTETSTPSVLVTGTNRGLGLEFTRQYLAAGWHVIACCRRPHAAAELRDLAKRFDNLSIHTLDLCTLTEIEHLAKALTDTRLDLLINNAGVYGGERANRFGSLDYELWQDVLRVNTLAPVKMAETFLPHLARSRKKLIVGITSLMGSIADNSSGGAIVYRSSKAALNAALKSLAIDLKPHGIGVLILHPGWVRTDMGGPRAPILPEESVRGMRHLIDQFTPELSGRFLDFRGRELPW